MINRVNVNDFLAYPGLWPILDVRAPKEFLHGHIPGAIMFPLFSDEERAIVGTLYHKQGKDDAVKGGMKIVGPRMHDYIEKATCLSPGKKVRIYCWRGGMRSASVAFLLETAGFSVILMENGYKSYRHYVRESFHDNKNLIVLGGYTGSGKTEILHNLSSEGEQVLDLEGHANHKGSIFGGIGLEAQPTNEQFENNIHEDWRGYNPDQMIWIEDESYEIGMISLPNPLYAKLREGRLLKLVIPAEVRAEKLAGEYGKCPSHLLEDAFFRINKRLGGQQTRKAITALQGGDYYSAALISLQYYDKAYDYALEKREKDKIIPLESHTANTEFNIKLVKDFINTQKTTRNHE